MRRSRWAEPEEEEEKKDEPIALTESQYRALKRGALFGTFGLALGVAATGLAAWSIARSPERAEHQVVAEAMAQPGGAQPGVTPITATPETAPSAAAPAAPAPAPAATSNVTAPTPSAKTEAPKPAATQTAARKTTTTRKASMPAAGQATTPAAKIEPQPASSVLGDTPPPAPAPAPVSSEPAEPVKPEGTTTP